MSVSSSTAIFFISLLAIPIMYVVNTVSALHGEIALMVSGASSLLVVCGLVHFAVRNKGHQTDPLLYVLSICAFGGVASLTIGLEGDGIIHGFMSEYLKSGEPYLKTAYGTMISYWDGIGHYALLLMMLSAISWNLFYNGKDSLCSSPFQIYTCKICGRFSSPTVLILGTFSSVADIVIALENEGYLKGMMTNYLLDGEPYLSSPHGSLICLWDGIGHYAMYLIILYKLAKNQSYREVGLYWAGSIGHSMIPFLVGNVVGKYSLRWSVLLNVPYVFIPFFSAARFLRERPPPQPASEPEVQEKGILRRPVDLVLVLGLIYAIVLALFRAFAVLGAQNDVFKDYVQNFEPYLKDPVAYPKIQMLVYLFHFVPYYVMSIHGLLYPGCHWMPDWSLLHAGAATQAQVSHIGASLHHRTPYVLRVPRNTQARGVFWAVNLFLLIFPQILAYRCVLSDSFFALRSKLSSKKKDKSQ